jgi:hypothetical protein
MSVVLAAEVPFLAPPPMQRTSLHPADRTGESRRKSATSSGKQQSFRLQMQLFFETMPLTAEAPVSRPWWLAYPVCPCTTHLSSARSATRQLGSGQKEQAGEEALHWESSVFRDG